MTATEYDLPDIDLLDQIERSERYDTGLFFAVESVAAAGAILELSTS